MEASLHAVPFFLSYQHAMRTIEIPASLLRIENIESNTATHQLAAEPVDELAAQLAAQIASELATVWPFSKLKTT